MLRRTALTAIAAVFAAACASPASRWSAELAEGRRAAETGRPGEAERRLRDALQASESFPPDDPRRVETLGALAAFRAAQGDADEAESLYARAARLVESRVGVSRPETVEAFKRLADAQTVAGHHEQALESYRKALAAAERAWPKDDPRLEPRLYDVALTLEALRRGVEAEPLLKRALRISESRKGSPGPGSGPPGLGSGPGKDVAERLRDLAQLYQSLGRLDDAEPLYRRILAMEEETLGSDPLAQVPFFQSMALFEEARDRLSDAEGLYRRAVTILDAQRVTDIRLENVLANYAHLLRRQGRDAE
ncbi:MAG: tetratricopeptide repeat protein, partial [Elusimicrobia bacterium]|nr:tetratricopeptide repeat protein [Elusimicrobiota bacterium]